MPRFHFNLLSTEGRQADDVGFEFPNVEAAYLEAYESIPLMACDLLRRGLDPMQATFEIADVNDQVVFLVPFSERVRTRRAKPAVDSAPSC